MNIPNFENIQFIGRGGYLTEQYSNILQQLITALQTNLSDEGFGIPQQATTTITMLESQFAASTNPAAYYGRLLYDSTSDQLKVFLADNTFHVITTV